MEIDTQSKRAMQNGFDGHAQAHHYPLQPATFDRMVALRRDFHRHPELGWQEHRTAGRICAVLDELGIPYRRGVAKTGVLAEMAGPADVPAVALRADMDALPIHEETGLPFTSTHDGIMHACGHDGHLSMLLGAVELMAADKDRPAPIRLIFQPAEELGAGAQAMIREGALQGVGMVFGGHLDRHYPTGAIIVSNGVVNASTDKFEIRIEGQQAHGARPHESVDALVVGSLMVTTLQTLVSREVDPAHPSVVSVGRFEAGTAANVIAGQAVLEGTIRAQETEVRKQLKQGVARMARAIGRIHGARVKVRFPSYAPPVVNPPEATALARRAARLTVPDDLVRPLHKANMGAEDFSYYLQKRPGCYVRLGSQMPGHEGFPAHSSKFDFDEAALATGARYFANIARVAGEALSRADAA